jgi:hypothetical protein
MSTDPIHATIGTPKALRPARETSLMRRSTDRSLAGPPPRPRPALCRLPRPFAGCGKQQVEADSGVLSGTIEDNLRLARPGATVAELDQAMRLGGWCFSARGGPRSRS